MEVTDIQEFAMVVLAGLIAGILIYFLNGVLPI